MSTHAYHSQHALTITAFTHSFQRTLPQPQQLLVRRCVQFCCIYETKVIQQKTPAPVRLDLCIHTSSDVNLMLTRHTGLAAREPVSSLKGDHTQLSAASRVNDLHPNPDRTTNVCKVLLGTCYRYAFSVHEASSWCCECV